MKYLLLILLYVGRNFFKMLFLTLFWGLVFLMFYGLNELIKDL